MNAHCTARDAQRCKGPLCGHCSSCKRPLDDHDGLGVKGQPARCKPA